MIFKLLYPFESENTMCFLYVYNILNGDNRKRFASKINL